MFGPTHVRMKQLPFQSSLQRLTFLLIGALTFGIGPINAAPLIAFVTSTTGNGNLTSWPEAGNTSGLAAGDAICQARATAAGLADPPSYSAWLSDSSNDAYCRVFGLTGKKADQCGQASLPIGAGPWLRTDGVPFAATIDQALGGNVVYAPLSIDESGHAVTANSGFAFTGTGVDGTFAGDCQGWSSTSSFAGAVGDVFSTAGDWTFIGEDTRCSNNAHLMCLQRGSGTPLSIARSGYREAFLSSIDVSGDLGASSRAGGATGLAAGDAICRSLAQAANLYAPQRFKALLGNSTTTALSRFQYDGAFYRLDGLLFAHDLAELASGHVTLPLNLTETGTYVGEGRSAFFEDTSAWTGANVDATSSAADCSNWSDASLSASVSSAVNSTGETNFQGSWVGGQGISTSCSATHVRLFCLSDIDAIFHAEFDR